MVQEIIVRCVNHWFNESLKPFISKNDIQAPRVNPYLSVEASLYFSINLFKSIIKRGDEHEKNAVSE